MFALLFKYTWRKYKAILMTKPQTNPSAEEPQIPNEMEFIKHPTDMIELLYEKTFRNLGSSFVIFSSKTLCKNLFLERLHIKR